MPGLGTTDNTRDNAQTLSHALSGTFHSIAIGSLSQHVLTAWVSAVDGIETIDELIHRLEHNLSSPMSPSKMSKLAYER